MNLSEIYSSEAKVIWHSHSYGGCSSTVHPVTWFRKVIG